MIYTILTFSSQFLKKNLQSTRRLHYRRFKLRFIQFSTFSTDLHLSKIQKEKTDKNTTSTSYRSITTKKTRK